MATSPPTRYLRVEVEKELILPPGSKITYGDLADAITDAETDHSVNGTFSNTEVKGHLDALGTTINLILDALREAGLVESA